MARISSLNQLWNRGLFTVGLLTLLSGCATTDPNKISLEEDPWESTNRSVYAFNQTVDRVLLRPVAVTYDEITPEAAQQGINNFFTNLRSPWITSQLWLQGRFQDGSEQLGRFLINSVYGVGGIFDVADINQLPEHDTDLGATLARWGWRDSRYIVLPLLGPSTLRDGIGQITEMMVDPLDDELRHRAGRGATVLDVVQTRASFLALDATLSEAFDEYSFVRDAWLQRRSFELYGDQATLPDYDAFLEEDNGTLAP